eukprot:scaffold225153_cov19-Tisochrysis_lutea.AAC.1
MAPAGWVRPSLNRVTFIHAAFRHTVGFSVKGRQPKENTFYSSLDHSHPSPALPLCACRSPASSPAPTCMTASLMPLSAPW